MKLMRDTIGIPKNMTAARLYITPNLGIDRSAQTYGLIMTTINGRVYWAYISATATFRGSGEYRSMREDFLWRIRNMGELESLDARCILSFTFIFLIQ